MLAGFELVLLGLDGLFFGFEVQDLTATGVANLFLDGFDGAVCGGALFPVLGNMVLNCLSFALELCYFCVFLAVFQECRNQLGILVVCIDRFECVECAIAFGKRKLCGVRQS